VNENRKFIAWLLGLSLPSLAIVLAITIAAGTWERVRTKPEQRLLRVTGSATQRIVSDLIEWQADVETRDQNRTAAAQALRTHVETAKKYLLDQGIKPDDLRSSAVTTHEIIDSETVIEDGQRVMRQVSRGWSANQSISVTSTDIKTVERVSREITSLLEKGVPISSQHPGYHYTKLGEVKVDMLARAAADAHTRAQRIVEAGGGGKIGKLWTADMGVINVNPANSTATSWEGNNDKSTLEKDIITIVHLTYEL